jgi:hypothetical protein
MNVDSIFQDIFSSRIRMRRLENLLCREICSLLTKNYQVFKEIIPTVLLFSTCTSREIEESLEVLNNGYQRGYTIFGEIVESFTLYCRVAIKENYS